MAVVVYLWALRAVSYGAVSNDAAVVAIAMKPHCDCCFSYNSDGYERMSVEIISNTECQG